MKQLFLTPTILLCACASFGGSEEPEPLPPEPELAPHADGEYLFYTTVSSQYCGEETEVISPYLIGSVDLVTQHDSDHFNLVTPYNGLLLYTAYDLERAPQDGAMQIEDKNYVYLFPDSPPLTWKRWMNGNIWDDIAFTYAFEIGYDDSEGDYQTYCRVEADVVSQKRYATKTNLPRPRIGGKWRTKMTVLYDSWNDTSSAQKRTETTSHPSPLEKKTSIGLGYRDVQNTMFSEPISQLVSVNDSSYITIDITPHIADDSWFSLRGTYFSFDPLRTNDGAVNVIIFSSGGQLTTLKGFVTNEVLDLEFYWHWYDPVTEETHRELRIRYEGTPRYDLPVHAQSIFGEYASLYRVVEDTCNETSGMIGRTTDTIPSSDGMVRLGLTGFYSEPNVDLPDTGGVFDYSFTRRRGNELRYHIDGAISPHFLDATIRVDVHELSDDGSGAYLCHATYAIEDGAKRFRAFGEEVL